MELSREQREVLRWFAGGHSEQMVAQFVDKETSDVRRILAELDVTDRWQAERLVAESENIERLEFDDSNIDKGGEEVPEFKPEVPNTKLQDYDKREIAKRGGNQVDIVPLALQQAFRMDIKWRPLSEIHNKWMPRLQTEANIKAAIQDMSPSAFKRLYGED